MKQEVLIHRCETIEDFEIAKTITHDYMIWLGMDLGFQNTDKEFSVFNRMYGEARGAYIYARIHGEIAGGVGLRMLSNDICEMKRLFVYEHYRGCGLAYRLCQELLSLSKSMSYSKMRLDTISRLVKANSLYEKIGFRDIPKYYDNPDPTVRYMEIDL